MWVFFLKEGQIGLEGHLIEALLGANGSNLTSIASSLAGSEE
jgi:hypothetical protein